MGWRGGGDPLGVRSADGKRVVAWRALRADGGGPALRRLLTARPVALHAGVVVVRAADRTAEAPSAIFGRGVAPGRVERL